MGDCLFSFVGRLFINLFDSSIFIEYRNQSIDFKNKSLIWFLCIDNTELNGSTHTYQGRIHLSSHLMDHQETLLLVLSDFKEINYLLRLKNKKPLVFPLICIISEAKFGDDPKILLYYNDVPKNYLFCSFQLFHVISSIVSTKSI